MNELNQENNENNNQNETKTQTEQRSVDLVVVETEQKILNILNSCQLPISIIDLIIGKIHSNTTKQKDNTIAEQIRKNNIKCNF